MSRFAYETFCALDRPKQPRFRVDAKQTVKCACGVRFVSAGSDICGRCRAKRKIQ